VEAFIKNLAKGAGAILRDGFRTKLKISRKAAFYDLVTQFDLAADEYIVGKIKKKFPAHSIISEESNSKQKLKKFTWVVDPLDGTHAFVKGIPQFSTSIALVHNGQIINAGIYDPIHDEFFYAQKKHGAKLNGRKISPALPSTLQHCNISPYVMSSLWKRGGEKIRKFFYDKLIGRYGMWTDRTSSIALSGAYLACGRTDIFLAKGFNLWDVAGAVLIMSESGARVTTFRGERYSLASDEIVGAHPKVYNQIIGILKKTPRT